ncbi:MAG: amino acid ABC transporter ATP-binding protein [Kordiimonadaceae bacterium]|nr:amino acid ABC transporter ATP-binding protein [Kordiimonadaceae bacterium]MBT6036234.1 amino acid ABC transporter ATP-binding protein [Kordiimonadaceae bacterium]MBT6330829.1 amino acid ABC transporter ATP-binding protein [Kordiimonadaceae bacterium]
MLHIEGLNKYFDDLHILKSLTTTIHKGEVVAIMGPSGSGKSTFIRCINRIEEPTSGQIFFGDIEVTGPDNNISNIRRDIGMVFQNFALFPHLTALENIMLAPTKVKKKSKADAKETALALLKRVGLEDKASSYPEQLSGGQQQRVAIARSLAMDPKILLFDEPTSALDPEMVREVLDVMVSLAKDGMTMIVVSHEINFIKEASSRVLVLVDGEIIEDGPSNQVIENPSHQRTKEFLGKIL